MSIENKYQKRFLCFVQVAQKKNRASYMLAIVDHTR